VYPAFCFTRFSRHAVTCPMLKIACESGSQN
jgi:hypothetical protein